MLRQEGRCFPVDGGSICPFRFSQEALPVPLPLAFAGLMLYFSAEKRQDSGLLVTARLGLKRLIQIGEEIVQRVVGDAPAKRVVGDLDGAFEIGSGIVVQYRAVWLITDANLPAGIDGAAGPLPFHLKHQ